MSGKSRDATVERAVDEDADAAGSLEGVGSAESLVDLNLKQVARRLGVHYMTAYRYVRSGRLPAHQVGTAWLVTATDLAAFAAGSLSGIHLPAGPKTTPTSGPGDPDRVELLKSQLVMGNGAGAWSAIESALVAGWSPEEVLVDLIVSAVRRTGPADGEAAAHLAVTTATRSATELAARFRRPGRSRGTVVLGSPQGEHHTMGLAVIADVLRLRNVQVLELGSGASSAAFVQAASRAVRLVAIGIGVTSIDNLDAATAATRCIRAVHPEVPVLLGGHAVANEETAAVSGASGWAGDARGMADLIETYLPTSRAAKASA